MRTRSRHNTYSVASYTAPQTPLNTVLVKCDGETVNGTISYASAEVETARSDEGISDDIGKGTVHPVVHRKKSRKLFPLDQEYATVHTVAPYGKQTTSGHTFRWLLLWEGQCGHLDAFSPTLSVNTSRIILDAAPPKWVFDTASLNEASLKEDVFERANGLKADVMLNLVESNQAWPSVKSLATAIPEMAYLWSKKRRPLGATVRNTASLASGGFLAWKFGVSPIISDVKSLASHLPRLAKDAERHNSSATQRYAITAFPMPTFDATSDNLGDINNVIWFEKKYQGRLQKRPVVRYVLVVKPKRVFRTDTFKVLSEAMNRFTTSPASLAWERIPFSFVLDWFVDVRGALRSIDDQLGTSPYEVKSLTRSFNYRVATDMFIIQRSLCDGSEFVNTKACSFEYEHYDRMLVPPGANAPTWKPRFGKSQAGISAALITQQLANFASKRGANR